MYSQTVVRSRSVMNLDAIPTPGTDCADWRKVTPHGHGHYRLFDSGNRAQFAYPDGRVLTVDLDR